MDQIIGYLLFSYSALTIRIVQIVFRTHKMNEYKYRIPLFGPNYSNSRIVRIIRPNTDRAHVIHLPFVTIHRVLYSARIIYETYFLTDECSILSKYFLVWKIYDCGWVGVKVHFTKRWKVSFCFYFVLPAHVFARKLGLMFPNVSRFSFI